MNTSSILNLWNKDNKELHYLSVYRTIENWSENIIKSELQNQIKDALQQCGVEMTGKQINKISAQIIDQVISKPFHKKSVGIFAALNLSNPDNVLIELENNLIVIFSDEAVADMQCCGEIFCMTNLFKMNSYSSECLCIYVSRKNTSFYSLNDEFNLISKVKNVILEAYEDRYRGNTPGAQGVVHSGSSADEKEMKFAKKILNDMINELSKIAKKQNQYKCIFIVYTNDFANYSDFIEKELTYFSEMKPVQLIKGIDIESHFEMEFKNLRKESFDNLTKEKLEKYKVSIGNIFTTKIDEIVSASREGRIQKLYLKDNYSVHGFISDNDMPYLNNQNGAKPTKLLVDWLIKKIIETKGEIFILESDSQLIEQAIAAKFRY